MASLLERHNEYGYTFLNEWRCNAVSNLPNESFFFKDGNKYVAVSKTADDLNMEECVNEEEAISWLESAQKPLEVIKENTEFDTPEVKLNEWLTIKDLRAPEAISNFTKNKKAERQKLYGTENRNARLVNAVYDPNNDSMTFYFITTSTLKAHPADYSPKKTDPDHEFDKISNPEKMYTMEIRMLNFLQLLKETRPNNLANMPVTWQEIKQVLDVCYIQIHCNCPAFWWQGTGWYLTQLDGAIHPCSIAPKKWNSSKLHGDGNFHCKHTSALFSQLGFFLPQMASMSQRVLKQAKLI